MTNLLLRIFDNIIKNPNNPKYQNLNYNTIYKKFVKCKSCVDLLICCGFYKSNNGERLLFNTNKLQNLKQIKKLLLSSSTTNAQNDVEQPLQRLTKYCSCDTAQIASDISTNQIDEKKQGINVCYHNQSINTNLL